MYCMFILLLSIVSNKWFQSSPLEKKIKNSWSIYPPLSYIYIVNICLEYCWAEELRFSIPTTWHHYLLILITLMEYTARARTFSFNLRWKMITINYFNVHRKHSCLKWWTSVNRSIFQSAGKVIINRKKEFNVP